MNLDAIVERGCVPWSPSSLVADLEVWQAYEVPLVGTFTLGGQTILFSVVGDADASMLVYAYVPLTVDVSDRTFVDAAELGRFVNEQFDGQKCVIALAPDARLDRWSVVLVEGSLYAAANQHLDAVLAQMKAQHQSADRFKTSVAELGSAVSVLGPV